VGTEPAFLKIRCPNKPEPDSTFECRGNMGGYSIEFIKSSKFPIVDIRYCHRCGAFVRVTIDSVNSHPNFCILNDEEKAGINFIATENFFGGYSVEGRHIKKEKNNG
jgi:hypothetical protein